MSDKERQLDLARELRQAAEEELARFDRPLAPTPGKGAEDLLHELQVHQIELEMQNEELRGAQLTQEEAKNRFAELYDFAPVGYFTLSHHGRISSANLTGAALLGVPRKELIDQSFGRYVAPEVIDCWDRHILEALKEEGTVSCELLLQRDDGSSIHVRLDSSRAVAENGAFTLRTTVVDITESKRAKDVLKAAETDYRVLFDRVPSGLYRSTPDGRFLAVNQALVDILGYSSVQELMNADIARMFYSTSEERRLWVDKLLQIGEFRNVEIRVLRKDGSPLVLLENSQVVRDEAGGVLFFEGSLTDITDRKRAEAKNQALLNTIQEEKTKLSALIDSIADEVWFADTQGRFTLANQSALREFALAPGEPIEVETLAASLEVLRPDGSPRPVEEAPPLRALAGEVVRNLEEIIRTPASGGLRHRQVSSTPVRDAAGMITGVVSVVRDITELKQAEETLRASESSLQTILQSTADGLLAVDRENRIILANYRFQEMWKIPKEIMISKDDAVLLDFVLGQLIDPQSFLTKVQELYKSDEDSFDTLYFKDGRVFERFSRPLLMGTELRGRVWSFRDVTERNRAEDALRSSEENYRFMFDHNPQPMVIYDLETLAFLEVNQSAVDQYGYSREEFLSMTLRDIHPAEDIPILLADIELARRSDNPTGEWRHVKKNGKLSSVEIRSHSVCYHGKNARHILIHDITERKRAEEALMEERKLFMAGPTVVFRWQPGPPWQVTYASPNTKKLLGYPAEAFTSGSLSFADIIHPDDVGRLAEEQRRFIQNERAYYEQEYRLRRSDGQFLWVHDFTRTVVINGSRQDHGYITDITERKRAEEAHLKSERQYRQLIETMQDGVYRSSHEGRFLEVNPAMVKILGYDSVDELLAIDIPSQLYFALEDRQSAALKEKLEEMGVFRLRKKDGSEIWVEDHGRHVVAEDGTVLYHEGILRDITDRKRAEEELRVAKMVVENSPTVIFRWLAELGWPVEYVTENVTLFGFKKEELMHKKTTFAEIVHPDDRERTSGEIDQHLLRGEDQFWLEYRLVSPKGEAHWVDDHTTVIRDATGKVLHYEGTITDISERKQLEAEVERARMDFIFAVSHELKTPLLIMAATEEMVELLPAGQRGERFYEYSDVWKRNLIRLRTNIDNLVDSQRSPGTGTKLSLQSTDLGALIDRSLNDLAPLAEKKDLQVRRELDAVRPLFLDPEACIRIVTNLLTNAIKFSPPSALLRIELKEEEDQAVLRICDEGPGIPVEEMPNLFQPFRRGSGTVQAVVPGTGLGLYVSRILTEAQGGTIELESEVGRGTTAIIRFPLQAPEGIH